MSDLALPLTQSEAFERTCETLGLPVKRIETTDGSCLVQSRRLPVIGTFNLISRGPVLQPGASSESLMRRIGNDIKGPVIINAPDGYDGPGLKLMAGAELALIDLVNPEQMRARLHQNWRNQLTKSEAAPLRVIDQPLDSKKHAWFLEAEQVQQRSRRYRAYPPGFLLAYAATNKGQARLFTAMQGQTSVAAMLVLRHGRMATYQAGVTTPAGREHCAHNLLLWTMMKDLRRRGVEQLDLGRADLSDGLRRFKLRTGATLHTLPGTYLTRSGRLRRAPRSHQTGAIHTKPA